MKGERFEARGVTAAVIISDILPSGIAALDAFLEKTEEAFVSAAEKYALSVRDRISGMSARERRMSRPTRISLSGVIDGDGILCVTLISTLISDGEKREKSSTFFFDTSSLLLSREMKKRKNKTSGEKL